MSSARFATVRFMFQHKGRVRVALDKQSAESGGVDRLFEETLVAGAEDFDQTPGSAEDVEVEVRELCLCRYCLNNRDCARQILCAPNALGKITDAVTQSGLSQGLLSSELIYAPTEDAAEDDELSSTVKELVSDLEENESTLRVWTTLDS